MKSSGDQRNVAVLFCVLLWHSECVLGDDVKRTDLSGSVVDLDGNPVAGASIFWNPPDARDYERLTRTDEEGQFQVTVDCESFGYGSSLLVRHEDQIGFSSPYNHLVTEERPIARKPEFQLISTTPIELSVADEDGIPVPGVQVRMIRCWSLDRLPLKELSTRKPDAIFEDLILSNSETRLMAPQFDNFHLLPNGATEVDGKLLLEGVPQNSLVQLMLVKNNVEVIDVFVRTDGGEEITIPKSRGIPNPKVATIHASPVTLKAKPSIPVRGVVRNIETQQPISGLDVKFWFLHESGLMLDSADYRFGLTDEQGRFEVIGLPVGSHRFYVDPQRSNQAYIAISRSVKLQPGMKQAQLDYAVPPSVTVLGVVRDRQSKIPVEGQVEYFSLKGNIFLRDLGDARLSSDATRTQTAADGTFSLEVLPGPGFLTVFARGLYVRGEGADQLGVEFVNVANSDTVPAFPNSPYVENYEYFQRIDPAPNDKSIEVTLELSGPDVSIPLEFVNRTDEKFSQIYFSGETNATLPFSSAVFDFSKQKIPASVHFFDRKQDERRLVQVHTNNLKLSGWTFVNREQKAAQVEVFPSSTIIGRLLDQDGNPVVGAEIENDFWRDTSLEKGYLPSQPDTGYHIYTQEDGTFKILGLPAGLQVTARLSTKGDRGFSILRGLLFKDLTLERGETRDLGDVSMTELLPLQPN